MKGTNKGAVLVPQKRSVVAIEIFWLFSACLLSLALLIFCIPPTASEAEYRTALTYYLLIPPAMLLSGVGIIFSARPLLTFGGLLLRRRELQTSLYFARNPVGRMFRCVSRTERQSISRQFTAYVVWITVTLVVPVLGALIKPSILILSIAIVLLSIHNVNLLISWSRDR